MWKLLHGGSCTVVKRREQSQTALRCGWIRGCVELVFAAKEEITSRVARVMAHVVAHVRCHVRGRMGMMRGIALGVKVMMLLRWCFTWCWLNTCASVGRSCCGTTTARRQFDAQIGQVMWVRGHAIQESVHHRDGRGGCDCSGSSSQLRHGSLFIFLLRSTSRAPLVFSNVFKTFPEVQTLSFENL